MRVDFYHLEKHPLEIVLPKLLEKVLATDKTAVVITDSEERVDYINSHLWGFSETSFIPHGSKKDGFVEKQPIYITCEDENPNNSQFVVLIDGGETDDLNKFERCLDIFNGNDLEQTQKARQRWKKAKQDGHDLYYWQQTKSGGWEQKASTQ